MILGRCGRAGDRDHRETRVGFGDTADTAMHERQPHFVVLLIELAERVEDRAHEVVPTGVASAGRV